MANETTQDGNLGKADCDGKVRYDSRLFAVTAGRIHGRETEPYFCKECLGWHNPEEFKEQ